LGRIRQKYIKRTALELIEKYRDRLSTDFRHNREVVRQVLDLHGKMLANRVAGYVTRIMKRSAQARE